MSLKDGSPPRLDEKHLAWTIHNGLRQSEDSLRDYVEKAGYPKNFSRLISCFSEYISVLDEWVEDVFDLTCDYDHTLRLWTLEGTSYTPRDIETARHNLIKERYEASLLPPT